MAARAPTRKPPPNKSPGRWWVLIPRRPTTGRVTNNFKQDKPKGRPTTTERRPFQTQGVYQCRLATTLPLWRV